jgi:hypothetical protein
LSGWEISGARRFFPRRAANREWARGVLGESEWGGHDGMNWLVARRRQIARAETTPIQGASWRALQTRSRGKPPIRSRYNETIRAESLCLQLPVL